ncbi:MAG: glycosylhydrolase-like jelly roll fold domain-containing protein [Candidatus Brocadiia bacterium]
MTRHARAALLAVVLIGCSAFAAEGPLEAGFRSPPASCQPAPGWYLSEGFAATVAACPEAIRPLFERALAGGGVSVTPQELKRMATWQALHDARLLVSAKPRAAPPDQPYAELAGPLRDCIARLVYLCSKTEAAGEVFTQAKPAHGITLYPPAPDLYLVRRRLGEADIYLAVSQAPIDTVVTITFPRVAGPELWNPEDGTIRPAPVYYLRDEKTMLNLRLGPYGAVFVALRKPPTDQRVMLAPTLRVTRVAPDGSAVHGLVATNGRCSVMFANGKMSTAVVEDLPPPMPLNAGWSMKTRSPAKRKGVGIVELRCRRASRADEKATDWAAPDLDDSDWRRLTIGEQETQAVLAPQWKARWLTFEGDREERLFRKTFDLPDNVAAATLTVTADNGYQAFVNGKSVGQDGDWNQAETYEVANSLRQGTNAFAIRVTNASGVAGLLAEARIVLATGKLVRIVSDGSWKVTKTAPEGWQKPDFDDKAWAKPTVGRTPPVAPWGDVPGLPPDPATSEVVWYRFRLPAGARSIELPPGLEEPRLYVDGKPVALRDGVADLEGRVLSRPLVAALRTTGPATLEKPILCECSDTAVGVGNWLHVGYPSYSGLADYTVQVDLPAAYAAEHLVLDLGQVGCAARVAVNGRQLATRLWRPFAVDITDAVREGKNTIQVTVANTAANASGTDLPAERLAAGLMGPVRIRALRALTLEPQ